MTGTEVLRRALLLMGYTNSYGEVDITSDAELFKRGTAIVQQVFDDLRRIERPREFLEERLRMESDITGISPEAVRDIMPYGVAMFLAQSEGNGDSQAMFAELYNRKRGSARKARDSRRDVIPRGGF